MESIDRQDNSSVPKIVGIIVAILVCCACGLIGGAGALVYSAYQGIPSEFPTFVPPFETTATPRPSVELNRPPLDSISTDGLNTLNETSVPENDPYELACRLQAVCNVSPTVEAKTYSLGDTETFWITDSDTAEQQP